MSRRKRHKAQRRAAKAPKIHARDDCHHILYQKRYWTRSLKELRQHPYCRLYIPKDTLHKQIHWFVPNVPAPREISARQALMHLRLLEKYGAISEHDNLERRLTVLIALFDCAEPETTEALRKQLDIVRDYYAKPQ